MPKIINAEICGAEIVDPTWFIGSHLRKVEHHPYAWSLEFSNNSRMSIECLWRVIGPEGILRTSEDHEQKFGLPSPVDCQFELLKLTYAAKVVSFQLRAPTLDIVCMFSNGNLLEVLPDSAGYEAWQIVSDTRFVIATGGGKICTYIDDSAKHR